MGHLRNAIRSSRSRLLNQESRLLKTFFLKDSESLFPETRLLMGASHEAGDRDVPRAMLLGNFKILIIYLWKESLKVNF